MAFDATTSAFYVVTPEVIVDWRCPEADGGADAGLRLPGDHEHDAGALLDPGMLDAGTGGATSVDAGATDAGAAARPTCADGSLAEPVIGPVVSLVIQPRIHGGGGEAALIMPLPARPDVAVAPSSFFTSMSQLAVPDSYRVHERVTVVETPTLGHQCTDPHYSAIDPSLDRATESQALEMLASVPMSVYGCSAGESDYYRPGTERRDATVVYYGDGGTVFVEEIETTSDYDVNVISANTLDALMAWMDENRFAHSSIDDQVFGNYVGPDRWFVALRVHPAEDLSGTVGLAPLVVTHRGDQIPIQNELQFDPRGGIAITDVWVMAPSRVDAADGSAETMFAALRRLDGDLAGFGLGVGWLTELRIGRMQRDAVPDSHIVPISATIPVEPPRVVERTTRIEIPLPCCGDSNVAPPGGGRSFSFEREYDETAGATPPDYPREWLHTSLAAEDDACSGRVLDSGGGWTGSSSSPPGRRLRGCAATPGLRAALGWSPIWLALFALLRRSRRTRTAQKRDDQKRTDQKRTAQKR